MIIANYNTLDGTQEHTLGQWAPDKWGRGARYMRFAETGSRGGLVRDGVHSDLSGAGTASAAAAIGTNVLKDTGVFTDKALIEGSIGYISGGTGVGQSFAILEVVDADTAIVLVLEGDDGEGNWGTALATDSTYVLYFPGQGFAGDGVTDIAAGFLQYDVSADDVGKFGWVRQEGLGPARGDASATLATGKGAVSGGSGKIVGFSSTATTAQLNGKVGTPVLGDIAANGVVLLNYEVMNKALSYKPRPSGNILKNIRVE